MNPYKKDQYIICINNCDSLLNLNIGERYKIIKSGRKYCFLDVESVENGEITFGVGSILFKPDRKSKLEKLLKEL